MTRMSTRTHGVLDFLTAGTLVALPRMLGWGERVTDTLTKVAIGTLGYSLLTDYEYGVLRVLPMRGHLAIDAMSGVALCAAPAMFPEEEPLDARRVGDPGPVRDRRRPADPARAVRG